MFFNLQKSTPDSGFSEFGSTSAVAICSVTFSVSKNLFFGGSVDGPNIEAIGSWRSILNSVGGCENPGILSAELSFAAAQTIDLFLII